MRMYIKMDIYTSIPDYITKARLCSQIMTFIFLNSSLTSSLSLLVSPQYCGYGNGHIVIYTSIQTINMQIYITMAETPTPVYKLLFDSCSQFLVTLIQYTKVSVILASQYRYTNETSLNSGKSDVIHQIKPRTRRLNVDI